MDIIRARNAFPPPSPIFLLLLLLLLLFLFFPDARGWSITGIAVR